MTTPEKPILFFDGFCGLCDRFITWMMAHDRESKFYFAPLQGETAKAHLSERLRMEVTSIVYYDENGTHIKSDAVLRSVHRLGGYWRFVIIFFGIPQFFRDLVYDYVARNRYRWFGKRETCRLPSPEERSRLLN